jgi:oxygen-independent coproporphyrinogen-3 oxidase
MTPQGLHVDLALVEKYNVAGPRYTSYPPATVFAEAFDEAAARAEIAAGNRPPAPVRDLSLYFHLPFCETLCWFCGCTTVITLDRDLARRYVDTLLREIDLVADALNPERRVVQIHWGGGTPTFLPPDQIRRLGDAIRRRFRLAPDAETSVEVDPRRLTPDHVAALRDAGFNRASLGVQDFDPKVQEAVHRLQPRDLTAEVIRWLREHGFASINVDLIYGLPHQSVDSFSRTLDEVLALGPDRFAIFNYAHVPWMKPSQRIFEKRAVMPAPGTKLQLLKLVTERLTGEAGYVYIGMDHFARPDDELAVAQSRRTLQRNFQGYSTRGGSDIYGFGMSAISQTEDAYWQNFKELPRHREAVETGRFPVARGYRLTAEDRLRRTVIMEIMCNLGLDYATLSDRLGLPVATRFAPEIESLADLEADGLLRRTPAGIEITDLGRLLVRNIAMRFDATLRERQERRFSRTI